MRNIIREPVETMKEVIQKSSRLEAFLKEQIIGQEPIIESLSNSIKYGWCQLSTPGRPRGTLFLLGPTGVGKTESIRSAAQFMYEKPDSHLLRLDMSEFSRQAGEDALINLLGAPGGKSVGRLERFLEENQEGIILYDEIEKAQPRESLSAITGLIISKNSFWWPHRTSGRKFFRPPSTSANAVCSKALKCS